MSGIKSGGYGSMNALNNIQKYNSNFDDNIDVDVDDAFYEGYYEGHTDDGINIGEKMSGLLFCLCILATGFYLLYAYKKDKREEEKEEIRRLRETRIEAEVEKAKEEESKRTEIAEVLKGYGISMKSLIQSSMNVDIDDSNMDVVNLTGETTSSTVLVMDDDDSEIVDIEVPTVESKKKTNLHIYDKDDNENKNENEKDENDEHHQAAAGALSMIGMETLHGIFHTVAFVESIR